MVGFEIGEERKTQEMGEALTYDSEKLLMKEEPYEFAYP